MALGTGVESAGNPGGVTGAQEAGEGSGPFIQVRTLPMEGAVGGEMQLLAVSSQMDLGTWKADLLEERVGGERSRKGGGKGRGKAGAQRERERE